MNTKKNMLIVKGQIKTGEIRSCQYNKDTQKYDIEFNSGNIYTYLYRNVKWLREPIVLNPNMYQISREGKVFFNIQEIYVFDGGYQTYWHICFGDGSERDYAQNELKIVESCFTNKQAVNVFDYLKQVSGLSDIKNPQTGEKILPKRYEKVGFIGKDIALARYIEAGDIKNKKNQIYTPIFPFGCNKSQYEAVKNALENQISVIQGPPGTGKTQTILNIIANILLQGKSVQVVSNNNAAIDNVYEKLASPKYNLDFLVAPLGNSENKKTFIEQQSSEYPDLTLWRMDDNNEITLEDIRKKSTLLSEIFDNQENWLLLNKN